MYTHIPLFSYLCPLFLTFLYTYTSTFRRYHTLTSLSSLLPFHSVFIAIDFLVFLLQIHRFRLRIQSARAQPLQRRNSLPPRSRAHPFARVAPSAPSLCASNNTNRTLVPLTWSPQGINMLFDSTAGRSRLRLHSRWKACRKQGWFGEYLEVLRNRGTAEFHAGSFLSCC